MQVISRNKIDVQANALRVLYSFPHKLGAARICTTAWHQIAGIAAAGAQVTVFSGSICKQLPSTVKVKTTLARGRLRIPYRLLGTRFACIVHDFIVARRLPALVGKIDLVHVWPLGALRTLRVAKKLGIPTFLERPNAHTRFAYEIVRTECQKLGVTMPPGHEHEFNVENLKREEAEYAAADYLLCPSDFVAKTFLDRGFSERAIVRHQYGYDQELFRPAFPAARKHKGLTVIFAGGCAPRKGLHYALEAWLKSTAHENGTLLIAGGFVPGYAERLSTLLAHPSVKMLGHRTDLPELMRQSDVLVLPSIEEGSALVTSEARGSGCVLLVSDSAGAICSHGKNALVHPAMDVSTLAGHMDLPRQRSRFPRSIAGRVPPNGRRNHMGSSR